jgi:hypothetical protein
MAFYWQAIGPPVGLERVYFALQDTINIYLAAGLVEEAAKVRAIMRQVDAQLRELSVSGAAEADRLIRQRILATAVRPPTSGRLVDAIQSQPIITLDGKIIPYGTGAVGIASLEVLDKRAVNPRTGGIYWRAQEFGLPAVPLSAYRYFGGGRKSARGYFMPGSARPRGSDFRAHPYFQSGGDGPFMMRQRAVPARHFLRDGTATFIGWHRREVASIERRAATRLLTV